MSSLLLGELETIVMELLWTEQSSDVKTVQQAIGVPRKITLNTIQSTMERLHRKGLLEREKVSHAYIYSPKISKEELSANLVQEVISRVMGRENESMLSTFVDLAARSGDESLAKLERLIAARRMSQSGPKK
jgi:predicted transcriptional regulator